MGDCEPNATGVTLIETVFLCADEPRYRDERAKLWRFLKTGERPGPSRAWISFRKGLGPDQSLYRGDEAAALDYARRAFVFDPSYVPVLLRDLELRAGRCAEARALYEKTYPELLNEDEPTVDDSNSVVAIALALVLIRTGEQERADLLLDRSLEYIQTIQHLGSTGYGIADVQIYALQGEKQKALWALRQAIDEGWRHFWWYHLKHDPNLESLHDEHEFQAMVAEIEADMAAQLARVREMERNGELEPIPEISATIQ